MSTQRQTSQPKSSTVVVTEEGETIDGESLEGVVMLGVVTHEILSVYEADWMPV
ncbi:hypothetical protein [Pantoea ananatis]|uniref:hypothetical protein n=1 Tax=Pantoea ananas TaxID=553 RepID=UPI001F35C1AD|nr:hypothetical protein [Pantoea ananatis]